MLSKIRAILILLQFGITIPIVIGLLYIFRDDNFKIRHIWMALQIKLLGIDLEIEGEIDKEAQLIVINHQALLDIIIIEYLHIKDIAWVAKKEIAKVPVFGHCLKAPRMIIVDRESKTGLVKLLKEAKNRLSNNRPIAIFPEGTRGDGKRLRKFKVGAKMIAEKFNLKVQPVVLINTKKVFDSQKITQNPGKVKVICLDTVQAEKKSTWYEDLEKQMNKIYHKELVHDN